MEDGEASDYFNASVSLDVLRLGFATIALRAE